MQELEPSEISTNQVGGFDFGLKTFLTDDAGWTYQSPQFLRAHLGVGIITCDRAGGYLALPQQTRNAILRRCLGSPVSIHFLPTKPLHTAWHCHVSTLYTFSPKRYSAIPQVPAFRQQKTDIVFAPNLRLK